MTAFVDVSAAITALRHIQDDLRVVSSPLVRITSVLGTFVTSRFPRNPHQRLVDAGVPGPQADKVAAGASHGGSAAGLPAGPARAVGAAVPRAFTDAVHLGLLVGGIVLLVMAVPTARFVRHRPPGR